MGLHVTLKCLLLAQVLATALGEPSYYTYNRGYPYTNNYYTYYSNPFRRFYNYYNTPVYKSRSLDNYKYYNRPTTYDDDTVYVTDMYGNTRVSSARSLRGLENKVAGLSWQFYTIDFNKNV